MADRTFTVETSDVKHEGGRYTSSSPSGAARKAARQLFIGNTARVSIKFMIRETTAGSPKRMFTYVAQREKLAEPKVVRLGTSEIKYTHSYNVKACKMPTA